MYLNLVNIRGEICKPSLMINTIFIRVNLGNVQETFFVVFTGAEYNRLQNYKIIKFTVFVRGGSEGVGRRGWGYVLNIWEIGEGGDYQNWTSANKVGGMLQIFGILW